jgi:FtsP/CotA-like multicopper oxidase with cupredoxin domain
VLITIAVLLLGALGVTFSVPKLKAAAIRGFTLSASFGAGWNGSKPGPTITVEQGDTVNLVLISALRWMRALFVLFNCYTLRNP